MVDNDRDGDGRFWYGEDEADEPSVLYTEEAVIEEKIDFSRARETFSRSPTRSPTYTDSDYDQEIARVSNDNKAGRRRRKFRESDTDQDESIRPGAMSPISVKEAREKYLRTASSPTIDASDARERKSLKERRRFSSQQSDQEEDDSEGSLDWDDLIDSRYTPLIIDLADWIGYITGRKISWEKFFQKIWNGMILCELANSINKLTRDPKSKKIHIAKHTTKGRTFVRYNVEVFILWCKDFGVPEISLMDVSDLVEKKSVKMVLNTSLAVGREMRARSLPCPIIAVLEQTYRMSYDSMIDHLVEDKPLDDNVQIRDSTLQRKKRFQLIKAKAVTGSQITEPSFDSAPSNIQDDIVCLMYMKGFKKGDSNAENVIKGWQGAVRLDDYKSKTLPHTFKHKLNALEEIGLRYGQTLPRNHGANRRVWSDDDGSEDEKDENVIEELKRYKTPDIGHLEKDERVETTDYGVTSGYTDDRGYEEEGKRGKKSKRKKEKKNKENLRDDSQFESSDVGMTPKSKKKKKWFSKKDKIKSTVDSDAEKTSRLSFSLGGGGKKKDKKKGKKHSQQEEQPVYQNSQQYRDEEAYEMQNSFQDQEVYENTIEVELENDQVVYENTKEYQTQATFVDETSEQVVIEHYEQTPLERVATPPPQPESNRWGLPSMPRLNVFSGSEDKKKEEDGGSSWFPKIEIQIPMFSGDEDRKSSDEENQIMKGAENRSSSSSCSSSNDDSDTRRRKRSKRDRRRQRKKSGSGEYELTIPPHQFESFKESGFFGSHLTNYKVTAAGDYKVTLTTEQYTGFQKSMGVGEGQEENGSTNEGGYYMVLFTPNQWTRLRDEEDFLNLDLSYEKNPEGKNVVHMTEGEYQTYVVIQQRIDNAHADILAKEVAERQAKLSARQMSQETLGDDKDKKKKRKKHKKKKDEKNNRDSMMDSRNSIDHEPPNSPAFQEPEPDWFEQRRLTAEFNKRNSSEIETPGNTPRTKRKPVMKRWLSNSKIRDTSESEDGGKKHKKFSFRKQKKTSDSDQTDQGNQKKRKSIWTKGKRGKPVNTNPPLDNGEVKVSNVEPLLRSSPLPDHDSDNASSIGQWPNIKTRLGVNDDPSYSEKLDKEDNIGKIEQRRSPDRAKSPKPEPEVLPPDHRPSSRGRMKSEPARQQSVQGEESDGAFSDSSEYSIVSYPVFGRRKRKRRRRPTGTTFSSDVGCMDCIIAVICPWRLARAR